MFCTNCGSSVEDDAVFCPECGASLQEEGKTVEMKTAEAELPAKKQEDAFGGYGNPLPMDDGAKSGNDMPGMGGNKNSSFCPMCGNAISGGSDWCPFCGAALGGQAGRAKGRKQNNMLPLLGVGIAAAVLVLVVICMVVGKGSKKDSPILYMKDGDLMANYYKEDNSKQVDRNFDESYPLCQMTKDKKYLFYMKDSTLYVKKTSKLDGDETKIARDVDRFTVLDNNKVVFLQKDGTLCISDRKDDECIARDVTYNYQINEAQSEVIWVDEDGNLYWQDLALKKDREKLAKEVDSIDRYLGDFSQITYRKSDGFYILKNLKEEERIVENYNAVASMVAGNDLVVYYSVQGSVDVTKSVYDYIVDDLAERDLNIKEPDRDSYRHTRQVQDEWGDVYEDTEFDETYYDDYEAYEEKVRRDDDREDLQDETVSSSEYELFYYSSKSGSQSLCEGKDMVLRQTYGGDDAVVIVKVREMPATSGKKLSDLYNSDMSLYDFCEEVRKLVEGESKYYIFHGTEMANLEVDSEAEVYVMGIDSKEKLVYLSAHYNDNNYFDLLSAPYGSKLGKTEKIEKEVDNGIVCDGDLFYRIGDDLYYNGKRTDVDAGFGFSIMVIPDSDKKVIVTYESEAEYSDATLYVWNGKKAKKIEDDIYQYVILDENRIAMIQDYSYNSNEGDLIYYNGKKTIRLENNVTSLISY